MKKIPPKNQIALQEKIPSWDQIGRELADNLNRNVLLEQEFLTPEEVAIILKVKKITIYRMCRAGKLPAAKFGKVWRISGKKLMEVLEEKFK